MSKLWFNFLSKIITFIWTKICLILKFLAFFSHGKAYFCVEIAVFLRIFLIFAHCFNFFSAEWTVFLLFFLIFAVLGAYFGRFFVINRQIINYVLSILLILCFIDCFEVYFSLKSAVFLRFWAVYCCFKACFRAFSNLI